jgi:hypothetical protein
MFRLHDEIEELWIWEIRRIEVHTQLQPFLLLLAQHLGWEWYIDGGLRLNLYEQFTKWKF